MRKGQLFVLERERMGHRLTDEQRERFSVMEQLRKQRRARQPRLSRRPIFCLLMTNAELDALRDAADNEGRTMAGYVRNALAEYAGKQM